MKWHWDKGIHLKYGFMMVEWETNLSSKYPWKQFAYDSKTNKLIDFCDCFKYWNNNNIYEVPNTSFDIYRRRKTKKYHHHNDGTLKSFLRQIRKCPYFKKGDRLRIVSWYVGCADVIVTI